MEVRDFKSAERVLKTHVSIIRYTELPYWYVARKMRFFQIYTACHPVKISLFRCSYVQSNITEDSYWENDNDTCFYNIIIKCWVSKIVLRMPYEHDKIANKCLKNICICDWFTLLFSHFNIKWIFLSY